MTGTAPPPSVRFINRVYPPDAGATGSLLAQLAHALAARGHVVSVLAAGGPAEQDEGGVHVIRVRPLPVTRTGLAGRAISDLSLYPALLARAARLPSADVTVVMTDPPLAATLGPLIRYFKGGKVVHWAQDLYPDVAAALGVIPGEGILTRTLRAVSRKALAACDQIITPGRCMAGRLETEGLPAERIHVIPNWVDPVRIHPVSRENNPYRHDWGLEGRRVAMYAGNFGRAHPMHLLVDAAVALKARNDIAWVLVGDGPRRAEVEQSVRRHGLHNVQIHPFQPQERLSDMLSTADLHITLLDPRLEGLVVPSKLYGILASGRPCLFAGPKDAEPARVIAGHACGEVLSPASGLLLANRVAAWLDDPERCRHGGQAARRYACDHPPERAFDAFRKILRRSANFPGPVPKSENP